MTKMTCPLGHTDDAVNFHRPGTDVMGAGVSLVNSVVVCPECRVLFRRRSLNEQAAYDRMAADPVHGSGSDG